MAGRWLLKTEPEQWSWEHQQAHGGISNWDGVRNAQAQKYLRSMEIGDLCFFYHSGAKAKEIVGIARVCKSFYLDPSDESCKHGMVDIEAVSKFLQPLSLSRLKEDDRLQKFLMFRQPRLSVVPVSASEWALICDLGGELESPLLPPDYGLVEANDSEQALGSGNTEGKTISGLTELKPFDKIRVSDQTSGCNHETREGPPHTGDMPSQSSSDITRQSQKRKLTVNATSVKGKKFTSSSEACHVVAAPDNNLRSELAEVSGTLAVKDDNETFSSFSENITSKGIKPVPDTKKVYCRRSRKQGQVEYLNGRAEMNASGDIASAGAGRVYKRRNR